MKFLIIFTLAFATASAKDLYSRSIEVRVLENEGRIANGKNAAPGQFYYQVGINNLQGIRLVWCGGSFIGNNWILTAAHCIYGTSSAEVYLGATRRFVAEMSYNVSRRDMIMHPEWNPHTIKNNIGLIRIPTTSESSRIGIVRIPSHNNGDYLSDYVVIAGWGFTGDNSNSKVLSNNLKYATLEVTPGIYCAATFDIFYYADTHICVSTPSLISPCEGDFGAPLVLEGQNLQIGVFSFSAERGCEHRLPFVCTRVSAYLPWIKSKTGIEWK